MRILYIDHHAAAPLTGGDSRAWELARQWQQLGDEVTVLAAQYSHHRHSNPEIVEDFTEKKYEGVRFCYLLTPAYEHGVGSIQHNLSAFIKKIYTQAPLLVERYRPEVIISACGYPYDFFCMQRIAKQSHAKMVFELRETWPELQRELYPGGESRVARAAADYAMNYALKNANLVASLLPGGEAYCEQRGQHPHAYCNLEAIASPLPEAKALSPEEEEKLKAFREKYPFLIAFAGRLSARRQPEQLLMAAKLLQLQKEKVGIVFTGNGGYKLLLKRLARDYDLENVLLMDGLCERRQQTVYDLCDAIFYGDSRKLYEQFGAYRPLLLKLMQHGKPLLLSVRGNRDPAQQCGCAINSKSAETLAAAIRRMTKMTAAERAKMGEKGLEELRRCHLPEQAAVAYREALLRLWA